MRGAAIDVITSRWTAARPGWSNRNRPPPAIRGRGAWNSRCLHGPHRRAAAFGEGVPPRSHPRRQHPRLPRGGGPFRCLLQGVHGTGIGRRGTLIGISRAGSMPTTGRRGTRTRSSASMAIPRSVISRVGREAKARQGSKSDWTALIKNYGFRDEAEALAYKSNPVDELAPLAKAGIFAHSRGRRCGRRGAGCRKHGHCRAALQGTRRHNGGDSQAGRGPSPARSR